jgi:hypothetical protein
MKIRALKFRCNNYKDLASLSFFTDLKLLYLKLNMYILKDIERVIREIVLPCNLENLYLAHDYDGDTSVSKMQEYIKRICDNIKVPFGCKVKIIIFSSKEMIIYDMEHERYCNNKFNHNINLNYHEDSTDIKNIFFEENFFGKHYYDDDDFVNYHLSLSQLVKIQKLIEREE